MKYTRITPFGARLVNGRYIPCEMEQRVISRIIELKEAIGLTFREIANALNKESVPTRMGRPWACQSVHRIWVRHSLKSNPKLQL